MAATATHADGDTSAPTEQRLLDAADRLMHARGFESVGLAELCEVADARKGSFYHYFESKEALALAMLDRAWNRARVAVFEPSFGDPDVPLREQFTRYAEGLAQNLRRHDPGETTAVPGCRFGNFAAEVSTTHPRIRARVVEVLDEMTSWYATALRGRVDAGELSPDLDVEGAAAAICAHMEGLMLLAKAQGDPDRILALPDAVESFARA